MRPNRAQKKEGKIMDKLTFTIVEKKGETFDTFRFGGYNLTEKKTLAQALVDACATDKALAGGLFATCAALVDIARKSGYILSRAVIDCFSNSVISATYDIVLTAADNVATIKKQLARAKRDAERLAYIPTAGLGGTADEKDARERALAAALVDIRGYINTLTAKLADAQKAHRDALDKLVKLERAFYEENAKRNATDNNNDNKNN